MAPQNFAKWLLTPAKRCNDPDCEDCRFEVEKCAECGVPLVLNEEMHCRACHAYYFAADTYLAHEKDENA